MIKQLSYQNNDHKGNHSNCREGVSIFLFFSFVCGIYSDGFSFLKHILYNDNSIFKEATNITKILQQNYSWMFSETYLIGEVNMSWCIYKIQAIRFIVIHKTHPCSL